MRKVATLLIGLGAGAMAGAIVCASPASADGSQYLAHLRSSGVINPALSDSDLLLNGRMACTEVGIEGLTPDLAREWAGMQLENLGARPSYAAAIALVHYALQDLCPQVPNTTGI